MSARDKIAAHLAKGKTLTPKQAWKRFGTSTLGQHCTKLRERGYKISSYRAPGQRYHVYYLAK